MFDPKRLQKMQRELQERMSSMQNELADQRVTGSAGGGMVQVTVSGTREMIDIKIDREAVDPEDIEMLQDLIVAAANDALEKAMALSQQSLSKLMPGGTGIPGLPF